ncbi:MAG TPA: RsmG family class I SAM-dependent methyltransferase [Myxococcota bacterium]|nr:RsmG family class I SAM-dependent methyltransferase [Myxococcota bacterium]
MEQFHVEHLRRVLAHGLEELGLSSGTLERWEKLALLLEHWAARINLTGHRGAREIAERLLLEAAALSRVLPDAETLADLGSGAGIPGLPLAICRPDCTVRLIESRERRHHFQRTAIRELGLTNAIAVLGRAEQVDVVLSEGVMSQAMAQPAQALRWMRPWMSARAWAALPTTPSAPSPHHPDLLPGQVLGYAAPHGPLRSVWIARLRDRPARS